MSKKELIYLIVFGSLFVVLILLFIVILLINYYKKNRRYRENLLKLEYEKTQEVLKAKLEIQEQTFKNISLEMHDNIGQVLSLVKLNLASVEAPSQATAEIIANTRQLITKVIQDLRHLSHSINADYINEIGLVKAVGNELNLIEKTGAYAVMFSVSGTVIDMERQKELILFRIIQESLHNIIKHARGKLISVDFNYNQTQLAISVKDDGKGFEPGRLKEGEYFSLGIANMKNRAFMINAAFDITSNAGAGTTIHISVPV